MFVISPMYFLILNGLLIELRVDMKLRKENIPSKDPIFTLFRIIAAVGTLSAGVEQLLILKTASDALTAIFLLFGSTIFFISFIIWENMYLVVTSAITVFCIIPVAAFFHGLAIPAGLGVFLFFSIVLRQTLKNKKCKVQFFQLLWSVMWKVFIPEIVTFGSIATLYLKIMGYF